MSKSMDILVIVVVILFASESRVYSDLVGKTSSVSFSDQPSDSEIFYNSGRTKKFKDFSGKLQNSVLKSKIEVLGEVFKKHVNYLRTVGNKQVELVFLVDASASVGAENFINEIKFVQKLLADFTVSQETTRIAVITFASKHQVIRHIDHISQPSVNNHKCGLLNRELPKIKYTGGGTFTLGALREAQAVLKYARPSAQKALFLITDGFSNGGDPTPVANLLKQNGVIIFTFGIRNGNTKELYEVASSPGQEYSYILDSFSEFQALARRALHQDLKAGHYQLLDNSTECDNLCSADRDCCDVGAQCACGVDTGHFSCLCPPGYYGAGLTDTCQACPNGTYSDEAAPGDITLCKSCPDAHHVTLYPATSADHCACSSGFHQLNNTCHVISCPKLASPENGYFVKKTCVNVLNAACGTRCSVGYQLVGSSIRLCQEDGTWSGEEAQCIVKTCPSLRPPAHGTLNCSSPSNELDTECVSVCSAGYYLVGSKRRTCLPLGRWDGLNAVCKGMSCPALPRLAHGTISPRECTTSKRPYGTQCNITCGAGFTLKGPAKRSCGGQTGVWSSKKVVSKCVDNTPPTITCPQNVVTTTDPNESFTTVDWPPPEATDNSGEAPHVWTKPATTLPMKVKIGNVTITYVAMDANRNKARCSFTVTVVDAEPPLVDGCEDPPTFLTDAVGGADVAWDEPTFSDNYGKPVTVTRLPASNFFGYGTTEVTYVAVDMFGNNSTCSINVTVQENICRRPTDPLNGRMNCTHIAESLHCTLTCEEGYAFAIATRDFFCVYDSDSKTLLSPDMAVDPLPDCSVSVLPNTVTEQGSVTLETDGDVCDDSGLVEQLSGAVASQISNSVSESCGNDLSCDVRNFTTSCDVALESREETSNAISRRKRSKQVEYLTDSVYVVDSVKVPRTKIEVHFQMIGQQRSNETSALNAASLRKAKETLSTLAENDSVIATNKKKKLKVKRIGFRPEPSFGCPSGSVSKGQLCVKCPVGTRHNATSMSCESCVVGEYQPSEGQDNCLRCPPGSSTRRVHARHAAECKPLCRPGSYARQRKLAGVAPCSACGVGSYQQLAGQHVCVSCPKSRTTRRRGASSVTQCIELCTRGFYSANGLAPCRPCGPLVPDCPRIDRCLSSPCLNGGTCDNAADDSFTCECPFGFVGSRCGFEVNACKSSPCLHDGACVAGANATFSCSCLPGYEGELCETDTDDCAGNPCLHGGSCVDKVSGYQCLFCAEGYAGANCEEDVDECSTLPCANGSTCRDGVNSYLCECREGFTGRHCQDQVVDPCAYRPCENAGVCTSHGDNYTCSCSSGHRGANCETTISPCESHPCLNGATCLSRGSTYDCACASGFVGSYCSTHVATEFVLEFPAPGTTDYVAVRGPAVPLTQVSVCLWLKSADRFNYGTVFSYAIDKDDNSFTLTDYNGFVLYVNGECVITDIIANDGVWRHVCVAWAAEDGAWRIHLDGVMADSGVGLAVGREIPANGSLILGQEQDRLGGGFSQSESFMGHLSSVAMWDRTLTQQEITELATLCDVENAGNVFVWEDFLIGIRGGLKIVNSTFCQGCEPPPSPPLGQVSVISSEAGSVASYTCVPGFSLRWPDGDMATVYNRTCRKQGDWEGEAPVCTRLSCGFPGYFARGIVTGRSYRYQDTLEYRCLDGYKLHGEGRRTCQSDGKWSGEVPSCLGHSCTLPDPPPHGLIAHYYENEDQETDADAFASQPGHQIELECSAGYVLVGYSLLTCQDTGTWDDPVPSCRPVVCPRPQDLANGSLTRVEESEADGVNVTDADSDVYSYGDELTASCDTGFLLVGPSEVTCLASASWSELPECVETRCDLDTVPFFSRHFLTAGTDDFRLKIFEDDIGHGRFQVSGNGYGDRARFECNEGHSIGARTAFEWVCSPAGVWESEVDDATQLLSDDSLCQPLAKNCSAPLVPDNGYLTTEAASSVVGTAVEFKCRLGYDLSGPRTSVCQRDGRWSDANLTHCQPVECKRPPRPTNVASETAAVDAAVYGNLVTYVCEEGYAAYGDLSTRCQANGKWSRLRGRCTRLSCGKPKLGEGVMVLGKSYLTGHSLIYVCPAGSHSLSDPYLNCLNNATWDREAICVVDTT